MMNLKMFAVFGVVLLAGCAAPAAAPAPDTTPTPTSAATVEASPNAVEMTPTPSATPTGKQHLQVAPSQAPAVKVSPTPRMAPTNKVMTAPAPSPTFTEHNSGDGNDECFHDCGEPTDSPKPTREQELAALEPYWDSLAAEEIYVLCDSFRFAPWAAALEWKAATESRLDPADIAWWFQTQCKETGL